MLPVPSVYCMYLFESNKEMLFAITSLPFEAPQVQLWFTVKWFNYTPITTDVTVITLITIICAAFFTILNITVCNSGSLNNQVLLSNITLKPHPNVSFSVLLIPSCLESSGPPTVLLRCLLEMNSRPRSPFSYTPFSCCIFTFCHFIPVCDWRSVNLGPLHGQYLWEVWLNPRPNCGICF